MQFGQFVVRITASALGRHRHTETLPRPLTLSILGVKRSTLSMRKPVASGMTRWHHRPASTDEVRRHGHAVIYMARDLTQPPAACAV